MNSLKQIKYLFVDLDRWNYASLKLPVLFMPIVLLIYPASWTVLIYRVSRAIYLMNFLPLKYLFFVPIFFIKRFIDAFMSNEISEKADIGPGLYIAHSGSIVIGAGTKAGKNFSIRQGVTFGGGSEKMLNHPIVGDNVIVGAGAKVIGGVKLGSDVMIGANAVVVKDLPNNSRAAGIPAKIINNNGVYGIKVRNHFWKCYYDISSNSNAK